MLIRKKSYAKINLNLKIIDRAKNGYHKLESVMSLIDIYDEITFEECDTIKVEMNPYICDEKDNLCYKVAQYMYKLSKVKKGIKITIKKQIPVGGGLGGGSSNAATVMMFLNQYWKIYKSRKELMKIAFKFGADIPFFMGANQSVVSGFGEKIKRLHKPINKDIVLIVPPFSLNTKEVFKNVDVEEFKYKKRKKDEIVNDLEKSANIISNNEIYNIKKKVMDIGKGYCLMSGSGSVLVYYINKKVENSNEIKAQIQQQLLNCKVFLSKLITN